MKHSTAEAFIKELQEAKDSILFVTTTLQKHLQVAENLRVNMAPKFRQTEVPQVALRQWIFGLIST